jgi:hypothetical protein
MLELGSAERWDSTADARHLRPTCVAYVMQLCPCGTTFVLETEVLNADTAFGAASDESRVPVHNAGPSWGGDLLPQPNLLPARDRLVAHNLHGCAGASAGAQEAHENTGV